MNEWLTLAIGLALGGVVGWLWAASRAGSRHAVAESAAHELRTQLDAARRSLEELQGKLRSEGETRAAADARLKEAQANLEEQKKLLEDARQKLADTFNALASEALKSNNQAFIQLARQTFETVQAQAKGDLETRQKAIQGLVEPLKETLSRYEQQIQAMEKSRQAAYGGLAEQVRQLSETSQQLRKETGSLVTALSTPLKVRGRWGELTLRRVAELVGMAERCDFTQQESVTTEEGRLRADMVVHLPGDRRIVVDAKVPLQAFLDAISAESEDQRKAHYDRHSALVREHMNRLSQKAYWQQFDPAPEFVVLFLPGESFFSAAVEHDPTLIEDGVAKRVVLATPTTLIALLQAVAFGWRQEQLAQNAQAISELGKQLYDRLRTFLAHFDTLRSSLQRAVEQYNKAVGSLESRVLPAARKFKELGAGTGEEMAEIEPVDEVPRALAAPERDSSEG
jgi:DNA recombination protein RmuC